jgi:hypothetical protein
LGLSVSLTTFTGRRLWLAITAVLVFSAAAPLLAPGRARAASVLRVGTFNGIAGEYEDVQAAVNAAKPGDWVLIAPGDYKSAQTSVPSGGQGGDQAGAQLLIQTARIHVRGMDRNGVWLDGTKPGAPKCSTAEADQTFGELDSSAKPGGRNGILVYKVPGVTVENLSACNFLTGDLGAGNGIWFDGGGSSGKQTSLGSWRGSYLTATSDYFKNNESPSAGYGIYSSNTKAPGRGVFSRDYASNMNDSAFYVGACPDCNVLLERVHGENAPQGYSGTNSGGHIVVQNSEFDNNETGFATGSLNNDDAPSPQDGTCPNGGVNPNQPKNTQRTHSCWVLTHNYVHDNNNPNVPSHGVAGAAPVGTGITVYGGRHNIFTDNRIVNNGAWGILFVPFPDTSNPPAVAHCEGGAEIGTPAAPLCYFDDFGNETANNKFTNNGFFKNNSNGDIAELTGAGPNASTDSNCFHDNVDLGGPLTSDPMNIDTYNECGHTYPPATDPILTAQVSCDSGLLAKCPEGEAANYPRPTKVSLKMPPAQQTMTHPCAGVPANPWCGGGAAVTTARARRRAR